MHSHPSRAGFSLQRLLQQPRRAGTEPPLQRHRMDAAGLNTPEIEDKLPSESQARIRHVRETE